MMSPIPSSMVAESMGSIGEREKEGWGRIVEEEELANLQEWEENRFGMGCVRP